MTPFLLALVRGRLPSATGARPALSATKYLNTVSLAKSVILMRPRRKIFWLASNGTLGELLQDPWQLRRDVDLLGTVHRHVGIIFVGKALLSDEKEK